LPDKVHSQIGLLKKLLCFLSPERDGSASGSTVVPVAVTADVAKNREKNPAHDQQGKSPKTVFAAKSATQ